MKLVGMPFLKEKAEVSVPHVLLNLSLNMFITIINSLMLILNPSKEEIKLLPTMENMEVLYLNLKAGNHICFEC